MEAGSAANARFSRRLAARGAAGLCYASVRAVDKQGKTVDFLLSAKRDKAAAMRFFDKAMQANDVPEKVTMDKNSANKAAIDEINVSSETPFIERPSEVSQQYR